MSNPNPAGGPPQGGPVGAGSAESSSGVARTELQQALTGEAKGGGGAFAKYQQVVLGRAPLILYELSMLVAQNTPGAAGLLLRKMLFRRLLGRCGRNVIFGKGVVLRHPDRIWIGSNVVIDDNVVLDAKGEPGEDPNIILGDGVFLGRNTILSCKGGTIRLGDNANFGANCQIQSESSCAVGANVLLASYCYLVAGGNHGIERIDIPPIQQRSTSKGGIRLCDGVWLGAGVKVIDGVEMGRDSVAAAGAVVLRGCEDFDIVGGIPAKKLKNRLEQARAEGKPVPEGLEARKLSAPSRYEPVVAVAGAAPRKSLQRTLVSTAAKVLFSAALIWYLVSLQSKPARTVFDWIEVDESLRSKLEVAPKPEDKRQPLVVVEEQAVAEGTLVTYGVGSKQGSLISVRYGADGIAREKRWARGFWASVWIEVQRFDKRWLLFVGVFHLFGYVITSWNWKQMLLVQGRKVRFGPLVGSNIVAGLFNNVLPSNVGGDVIRIRDSALAVFGKDGQSDYARAATVVVMQRVIGVFALLLIVLVALTARAGGALSDERAAGNFWAFTAAAALLVVFLAWLLRPRILAKVAALLDHFRGLPLVGGMTAKFLIVLDTAARYREQRGLLFRIFLTSLILQINVVGYYFFCTYVVSAPRGFLEVFTAVPIVVILMTVVPSINGLGVRDWGFQKLLGLPPSVAIAFSLVDVLWRFVWGILGGILMLLRGRIEIGGWVLGEASSGVASSGGQLSTPAP